MSADKTVYVVLRKHGWLVMWEGYLYSTPYPANTAAWRVLERLRRLNPDLTVKLWGREPEMPVPDTKNGRAPVNQTLPLTLEGSSLDRNTEQS